MLLSYLLLKKFGLICWETLFLICFFFREPTEQLCARGVPPGASSRSDTSPLTGPVFDPSDSTVNNLSQLENPPIQVNSIPILPISFVTGFLVIKRLLEIQTCC